MNPFSLFRQSRPDASWHRIGLVSEFPEVSEDNEACQVTTTCKAFKVPHTKDETLTETDIDLPGELKDQVLIFKYKGAIHAIDHQCPHSAFPLSQGNLFDIEDFGITLSAGITCPKHGWSFDIFSGKGDRGTFKLKVWEVQLRDASASDEEGKADKEVWVRRKQRIG
ncbi:Rieske (2Fe-2S) protein, partial [Aspergillus stella-maris]|uniref:Rieske (2Fe-2S) protein n=1 Tax=Aspergillus stella-maris TaxID=1810926 RepID=UPI003CCCCF62